MGIATTRNSMYTAQEDSILRALGIKAGYPICASCGKKVTSPDVQGKGRNARTTSCPYCHHPHMAIRLGDERFWGFPQPFTYDTAIEALKRISEERERDGKDWDSSKWKRAGIEARLFKNAVLRWLSWKEKRQEKGKIVSKTIKGYRGYVNNHMTPLNDIEIGKFTKGILQDFYDGLEVGTKQRKNIMDALKGFFRWLYDRGEIERVPPWPDDMETYYLPAIWTMTPGEQQDILAKIGEDHRDIIEFLFRTGLRPSEACALMKVDINFKMRKALIRHNYSDGKLTSKPKQKKERWIFLSSRAWELVKQNIDNPTPFVFWYARIGKPHLYETLNKAWKRTGTTYKLYDAGRHTLATQLMEAGEPLKRVQEILGHADSRTTLRYEHNADEGLRMALDDLEERNNVVKIADRKAAGKSAGKKKQ